VTDSSGAALMVVFLLFGIAGTVLWIWAIVDVVRVTDESMFKAGNRLIWVLIVVLAGFVGALVYLFVGRPAKVAAAPPTISGMEPPPPPPPGSLP
jgi:Phospholipase_D-nuclease N-terminal